MKLRNLLTTAALAILSAQAHPGHEPFSEGTKHFLTSPSHLFPTLLFSGIVFAAGFFLQRRRERIFLQTIAIAFAALAIFS